MAGTPPLPLPRGRGSETQTPMTDFSHLLPSDEDVAFFHENGYYISKKIFSGEEIDAALKAADELYAGNFDFPAPAGQLHPGWTAELGDVLRKNDHASLRMAGLKHLTHSPVLGAVAAKLADTPTIRLWHDQLLYKPVDQPGKKANVGWHTDYGYWKTCSSPKMLTAWVPFHDCDASMGTISAIAGSNRWPDNTLNLDFFNPDLEALEQRFDTGGKPVVKVPLELLKGQVSFHHCLTIHGSGPNMSDHPRRSIAIHLQDDANRWQEYHFADGHLATHDNDSLVRQVDGHPDYLDPLICPKLWGIED